MVQIVNWLITRRCNLTCSYCAISSNYKNKPEEYPDLSHYFRNEMSLEFILTSLERLKKHNPDAFHIFYGGEPTLRDDLFGIVNYCNDNDIHYTIITNNSNAVQQRISDLFNKVQYIKGLTSSIDPIMLLPDHRDTHRFKKSFEGFHRLGKYKEKVNDVVAEITVDNETVDLLIPLVDRLTENGINSSITFIDIAKNSHYDFSNIYDPSILVQRSDIVKNIFGYLVKSNLDIHMKETLLLKIYNTLPSELDCKIEDNLHNLTIDADGSVRLCLRIRGTKTPYLKLLDVINENGEIDSKLQSFMATDKYEYCRGCNWTCMIMSRDIEEQNTNTDQLIHSDRRQ